MIPVRLLWVGPGRRPAALWKDIFGGLLASGLELARIRYLDVAGKPRPLFSPRQAAELKLQQDCVRGDFFAETGTWDVVLLDYVSAWALDGREFKPLDGEAQPVEQIQARWCQKLLELRPFQVWAVHDSLPSSTVIPQLEPPYQRMVGLDSQGDRFGDRQATLHLARRTWFWNLETAWVAARGVGFDVWQRGNRPGAAPDAGAR